MPFLHFLFKVFDHLYIVILNSFSGSLPISSSFIWTYVFLVYFFICTVFLWLYFFKCCVWSPLFSGFKESWIISFKKVEFFLSFVSALISLISGLCELPIGLDYAEFLFVCFSYDGQGWVMWYSCPLMIEFVFLFCLLFRWGVLHRVLLVAGWSQVLYSSGFLVWVLTIWYPLGLVLWLVL